MKVLTRLFCDDTVVSRAEARFEILTALAYKINCKIIQHDCRGFNNLSYTINLR
jgi:hypothetical protein